jgi:predicted nuclease of predicted toxin-antitoxin system
MKLLLDECVTRYVKRDLGAHTVSTVEDAGLKGLKNGELLKAASGNFDVLLTVDKNIPYQQNTTGLNIAILILVTRSNAYTVLKPLLPKALAALEQIKPGEIVRVVRRVESISAAVGVRAPVSPHVLLGVS